MLCAICNKYGNDWEAKRMLIDGSMKKVHKTCLRIQYKKGPNPNFK